MTTANLLLLMFVFQVTMSNAVPMAHTRVHSVPRRSAEFDAFLIRQQRQTSDQCPPNSWYSKRDSINCASLDFTQFDVLGRRNSGLLAAPKDQGHCGSCWAFAPSGTFTDVRNIATGSPTSSISPQLLTTCIQDPEYVGDGNGF